MVMTTYLRHDEALKLLGESRAAKELDRLLDEVRIKTMRDWRIRRRSFKGSWPWSKRCELFELYIELGSSPMKSFDEFHVINFFRDGSTFGINSDVPGELLVAYLLGVLHGLHEAKK